MVSLFHDAPVPHHQDYVRLPNGGQPVGHDKAGAPSGHMGKGVLNFQFRAGVNAAGSLVQDEHGRQVEHYPGNAQKLLLSLAQIAAVLGHHAVVAAGQAQDEAVGMGQLGGSHNLFIGSVRFSVRDVLPDGAGL